MSFIEFFPVINPQILNKLFVCLREEIKNYYSLIQKNFYEEIPYNKEIRKTDIESSKDKIDFLNKYINANIDKHMKILKLKEEIEKENEIKNKLEKKSKKIDDIINKGKKILIKDLPYFEKLSEYSNKKLEIAKLSSLDLINLTLRLSQQSKAPSGAFDYFNQIKNDFGLYSDYLKNKNRFLYPFPEFYEFKNSNLNYNYSEKNRLEPPLLVSPIPLNEIDRYILLVKRYSEIKLMNKNPKIKGVFFKYSIDRNIPPSYYSGEEYKEYSAPRLAEDCFFQACACKKGFKDSKIIKIKFKVSKEQEENISQFTIKQTSIKPREEGIKQQINKIDKTPSSNFNSKYTKGSKGKKDTNSFGTVTYRSSAYLSLNDSDDDEEEEKEDKDSMI